MQKIIQLAQEACYEKLKPDFPDFGAGDTINVHLKIKDKNKERIQQVKGVVIRRRGDQPGNKTFTLHKISAGIGVTQTFPLLLPAIQKIELVKQSKVRRSRIYYFQELKGKKAKLKEK